MKSLPFNRGDRMKLPAITLWQPYASLTALGYKPHETRSWTIQYRGPLAIHAARKNPIWLRPGKEISISEIRLITSMVGPFNLLPLGAVLCVVDLTSIRRTEELMKRPGFIGSEDYLFGNYSSGRWAWKLENIRKLEAPIPAKGQQGMWDWRCPPGVLNSIYRNDHTMLEDVEDFT